MTNHSKLHNPVYVGPGVWFSIHSIAAWAKTPEKKRHTIEFIKHLQEHFPCGECKGHFGNYIETHPMDYTIKGSEDSLFLWTVNFHNAVNYRLNKQQVTYEEAKSIYYTDSIYCTASCDDDKTEPVNKKPNIVPAEYPGYIF